MKKFLMTTLSLISLILLLASCEHTHEFGEWSQATLPTCTSEGVKTRICECGEAEEQIIPKTDHVAGKASCTEELLCTVCGEVLGPKLDHEIVEATCFTRAYCSVCEQEFGYEPDHIWDDPTCTESMVCLVCSAVQGEPLGHDWREPGCFTPERCARCGIDGQGEPAHKWKDATCNDPKKCVNCYLTEGEPLGHDISDATCLAPKACKRCHESWGTALPHKWIEIEDGIMCELCEDKRSDFPVKLLLSGDPESSQVQAAPQTNQTATVTVGDDGTVTVYAKAARVNLQWIVDESVNVNVEDAPIIMVVTKGYCTCGEEGVCYSLESCSVNIMSGSNTEISDANYIRAISKNYDPIYEDYSGFHEELSAETYPFAKGRINSVNVVFEGIDYKTNPVFEICYVGFFENLYDAMEYAKYFSAYVHEAQ